MKEALYAVLQQFDFATSFMWDMKSRMLTTHAQVTQKDYASTWVPRPRPRPHQTSYQDNFVIVYVWFCPNEKVWIKFKNRETENKFLKNLPAFQRVPTQTQCNFKHSRKKIVEEWKVLWWHSVRWRNSCQQHCQSQICTQAVIVWLTYRSITNLWMCILTYWHHQNCTRSESRQSSGGLKICDKWLLGKKSSRKNCTKIFYLMVFFTLNQLKHQKRSWNWSNRFYPHSTTASFLDCFVIVHTCAQIGYRVDWQPLKP